MYQTYTPYLFISVGATGAFFTLREAIYGRRIITSVHHCNLAQDADSAFSKARGMATELGLPLRTTREEMVEEMRQIQRASAVQMQARHDRILQQKREGLAEAREELYKGIFPFGRYRGQAFRSPEVDLGYINWIANAEFEAGSPMKMVQNAILDLVPDLILPKPDRDATVGEPKHRAEFEAQVVRQAHFATQFGVMFVTTLVTPKRECLLVKSGAFSPRVGETLQFRATIKGHERYQGQMQTVVQRVKVLEDQA